MNADANRNRPWVSPDLAGPDGLVGVGGDLRPTTLLRAYADGVFPWFNEGDPILWWSPDPRGVIELDGLHISRSLARTIRKNEFRVTADAAFAAVMQGCAERRTEGTWVTPEMIHAYTELHRRGFAHSIETWIPTDEPEQWSLVGGIYGVAIGGLFAGESMFHRVPDASKVALASLVEHLKTRGFTLFDVQMKTDHTERMGAVEIPRKEYLERLKEAVRAEGVGF